MDAGLREAPSSPCPRVLEIRNPAAHSLIQDTMSQSVQHTVARYWSDQENVFERSPVSSRVDRWFLIEQLEVQTFCIHEDARFIPPITPANIRHLHHEQAACASLKYVF
jgi:hypothetical protein